MSKKQKKLTPIPVILRRLYKLAAQLCKERVGFKCEICGLKKGELYNGKPQRVEAHHIMSRSNKNSPLKFDLRNLVCLCTFHHKVGKYSAHKHGLWFAKKFIEIRPDDAQWIIDHTDDTIDLKDRDVLKKIEDELQSVNLKLKESNNETNK